jgi:hypothetical protein
VLGIGMSFGALQSESHTKNDTVALIYADLATKLSPH